MPRRLVIINFAHQSRDDNDRAGVWKLLPMLKLIPSRKGSQFHYDDDYSNNDNQIDFPTQWLQTECHHAVRPVGTFIVPVAITRDIGLLLTGQPDSTRKDLTSEIGTKEWQWGSGQRLKIIVGVGIACYRSWSCVYVCAINLFRLRITGYKTVKEDESFSNQK